MHVHVTHVCNPIICVGCFTLLCFALLVRDRKRGLRRSKQEELPYRLECVLVYMCGGHKHQIGTLQRALPEMIRTLQVATSGRSSTGWRLQPRPVLAGTRRYHRARSGSSPGQSHAYPTHIVPSTGHQLKNCRPARLGRSTQRSLRSRFIILAAPCRAAGRDGSEEDAACWLTASEWHLSRLGSVSTAWRQVTC